MQNWQVPADLELSSDAALTWVCSAILATLGLPCVGRWIWLSSYFSSRAHSHCLAASYWGKFWSGQRILFQCDNSAAVQALQKYTSRNPHLLKLLRHMAYFAIKFNFNFSAVHVEGKLNQKAEALSRFRFQVFRELCLSADAAATDIDPTLFKDPFCPP